MKNNKKIGGLILILIMTLTACNAKNVDAAKGGINIIESNSKDCTTEEPMLEIEPTTTEIEQVTTEVINSETEISSTETAYIPPCPTFADFTAKHYNNEAAGKEMIYEYNETLGKWECVFIYGDVRIISAKSGNVRIECEGKSIELPWSIELMGTGEGMSISKQDVNGDGNEEIIFAPYIREAHPIFIFDLANWVDLSPYYCKNNGKMLHNGVYLNEEYTKIMLEALETALDRDGYSYEFNLREDGSLNVGNNMITRLDENGILHFYFYRQSVRSEWSFSADFIFDENGCSMINAYAETRYSRYLETVSKKTDNCLEPEVSYNDKLRTYYFTFTKDNVSVKFETTPNTPIGYITIEYDGQSCPQEWYANADDSEEVYFELQDVDNDGSNELIWHETILEGEKEKYTRRIYDFETMSEITP